MLCAIYEYCAISVRSVYNWLVMIRSIHFEMEDWEHSKASGVGADDTEHRWDISSEHCKAFVNIWIGDSLRSFWGSHFDDK